MRGDEQPSTSAAALFARQGTEHRSRKTANSAQPPHSDGPRSGGPPWSVWRVWSEGIYDSLEEHLATGSYLYSKLALSKLFLDKLGIWETDYKFHNPKTPNFTQVFILRVMDFTSATEDDVFWINGAEVACAETAGEKEKRRVVEVYADQGRVIRDIIKVGDYLVIWNVTEKEGTGLSLKRKLIVVNSEEDMDPSFVAIYRHNGEFSYPITPAGYIQNNVKQGEVRNEFCRGDREGTDVVYVQRITPARAATAGQTWRLIPPDTGTSDNKSAGPERSAAPASKPTVTAEDPVALDDQPLFTSTPMAPPPPRPASNGGAKSKVRGSPTKQSSQLEKRLSSRVKRRREVVESDDDEVTVVDIDETPVVVKSKKTDLKSPTTPAPRRSRRSQIHAVKLVETGKALGDFEEMDDEEEYFEDAEDNLEEDNNGNGGEDDGAIQVVDISGDDDEGGRDSSLTSTGTFMTALTNPEAPKSQVTPQETNPPVIGTAVEVSTVQNSERAVNQCVQDTVNDLVGGVVDSEQEAAKLLPVTLEEILELELIRHMCADSPNTSGQILNQGQPPLIDNNVQGPSTSDTRGGVVSSPTAPALPESQDKDVNVNDQIWTQMVEMHYGSQDENSAPATPSPTPYSQPKSSEKKKTDDPKNASPEALPSTSSQAVKREEGAGGSRRNLFTQEFGGPLTQMVTGEDDMDDDKDVRPLILDDDEYSTDDINAQPQADRGGKKTKKQLSQSPSSQEGANPKPPVKRLRLWRAGMSQQSQETGGGERNPMFPLATQGRILRHKETVAVVPERKSTTGSESSYSSARDAELATPKKKRGRPPSSPAMTEVEFVPATPTRSTRSAGSSSVEASPLKVVAKLPSRGTKAATPKKATKRSGSVTSSSSQGNAESRTLRDRNKKKAGVDRKKKF